MGYTELFARQADEYARYRPRYPVELFARLAALAPGRGLVWDCATGSGQAAEGLLAHFERVAACDTGREQLSRALRHPRILYWQGSAEQAALPDHSVDLITVAQAAHWLDLGVFYREVRRVLRPDGILALWTYSLMRVDDAFDRVIDRFYRDITGPYWSPRRRLVDEGYRTLPFPFAELTPPVDEMRPQWKFADIVGFLHSWSAVQKFIQVNGYDPLREVYAALEAAWGDPTTCREVRFPLHFRLGRV